MTDGSPLPPGQPPYQPGQPQPGQHQPGGGYPPQGYGPPTGGYPPTPTGPDPFGGSTVGISTLLAAGSVAAITLAVSLNEDDDNGWGRIGVWAGFAIASAVLTLAPSVGRALNLTALRAWRVAAAGAVGLVAFWVLFVLPSISMNVSFAATVGVAAGVAAAWMAPGRPASAADPSEGSAGQTW